MYYVFIQYSTAIGVLAIGATGLDSDEFIIV